MHACSLSDVLLEAGLVGSGTINGVLSGKNNSRAMMCHKTVSGKSRKIITQTFLGEPW